MRSLDAEHATTRRPRPLGYVAGLGLVPPVIWTSLPALLVGLVAVYTGLVGISETGSKGLRGRGKATVGIALGTLGMFLPRMLQMLL